MVVFAEVNAWYGYALGELARARSAEEVAEEVERQNVGEAWKDDWKPRETVTAVRQNINVHDRVVRARMKVLEVRAYRRMVEAITTSLEKDRETISREVTRRSNDLTGSRGWRSTP